MSKREQPSGVFLRPTARRLVLILDNDFIHKGGAAQPFPGNRHALATLEV